MRIHKQQIIKKRNKMASNEYKLISLDDIHPHPHNPRKNDKAAQIPVQFIAANGFIAPIIVDETGKILGGQNIIKVEI